jgi:hypothetical protein
VACYGRCPLPSSAQRKPGPIRVAGAVLEVCVLRNVRRMRRRLSAEQGG